MNTLSRKERERLDREQRILELARQTMLAEGYHGLSMDRIAAALEYSKGTIYNHFSCKEEIIIALLIQTTEQRTAFFQRAAAFRGSSRERLLAIGVAAELFFRLFPDHFKLEHLIRADSIWDKTSPEKRILMQGCENRCMALVAGLVRDGLSHGELELPVETTPEDLVFGLWGISYGIFSLIASTDQAHLGVTDPFQAYRFNTTRMLDGYGWRPLSSEHDYDASRRRIEHEVFAHEFRHSGLANQP